MTIRWMRVRSRAFRHQPAQLLQSQCPHLQVHLTLICRASRRHADLVWGAAKMSTYAVTRYVARLESLAECRGWKAIAPNLPQLRRHDGISDSPVPVRKSVRAASARTRYAARWMPAPRDNAATSSASKVFALSR